MPWLSLYGTGATLHDAHRVADDRVEFTVWLSFIWIPLVPLGSYNARYAGEMKPDGITDEGHSFADLQRIPHDPRRLLRTFVVGLALAIIGLAPVAYMIVRTDGRAATKPEVVVIFAAILWPILIVWRAEAIRKRNLRPGSNQP